jgi:hypothetical protein
VYARKKAAAGQSCVQVHIFDHHPLQVKACTPAPWQPPMKSLSQAAAGRMGGSNG